MRDFHKIAEFVPCFRMRWLLKFCWICSRGYRVTGLSWRGLVILKFSAPPSGETMRQTPKVLEVQERARGPLSQYQVWWGSDFTRRRGGQSVEFFCLSVCLSVCPSRFWTSEIVRPISPWRCWSTETILISFYRGRFVVVHRVQLSQTAANWRHH